MAITNSFKQYERGARQQLTEENFVGGMSYANIPLSEGVLKTLVNFNISEDGQALSPREGLQVEKLSRVDAADLENTVFLEDRPYVISTSKVCFEADSKRYDQVIINYPDGEDYWCMAITIAEDGTQKMSSPEKCRVILPQKAEIHGVALADTTPVRQQVGTFAFNNSYFFFNDSGTLCYTEFDTTDKLYKINTSQVSRSLTPAEAVKWGYNMLNATPFHFESDPEAASFSFYSGGICLFEEDKTTPAFYPKTNTKYSLQVFYTGPLTGKKVTIEWLEVGGSSWNVLKAFPAFTSESTIETEFAAPTEDIMFKVTAYEGARFDTVSSVITSGVRFDITDGKVEMIPYTLPTATKMAFWKDRLFVAGVAEDKNILFASRTSSTDYFPYPNNIDTFSEPIINLVPFLETLLVFTSTKLYQLVMGADGLSWTKICIQEHLNITPWDVHLTQVVKNMVFFKSGNHYFMVVPKANAVTGTLTLAPITRNIREFLDNFKPNTDEILKTVYDFDSPADLIHYYNFLDYEFIYNVYVFKTQKGLYINFCLLYNSVKRYWKINIYETQNFLQPLMHDATKTGTFVSITKLEHAAEVYDYCVPHFQYIVHDKANVQDRLYPGVFQTGDVPQVSQLFKNYQLLDTGYREHNAELKKRYRELQFKLENPTATALQFNAGFYIDGQERKSYYKFVPTYNEQTQEIYMAKELIDPLFINGATVLNEWMLDVSEFPGLTLWKIRTPVSGKGYCPRICFVSHNEKFFNLHSLSWVYRILYSR